MKRILPLIPFFLLTFSPAHAANGGNVGFLQVEGMMLGYYPDLAEGVRVSQVPGSRELKFEPGRTCLRDVRVERSGAAYNRISFEPNERFEMRNKLSGLIGYPGISPDEMREEWLRSANGLAAGFYRDNLAKNPDGNVIQLLFMPMVLSPKPVQVTRTEWTPEARRILDAEGWAGLERHCGSHFVEALGEENFVIYSVRITLPDSDLRGRLESLRLDSHNQSPPLVLNNLFRLRQRFEFNRPGSAVTLDVLQVGGREADARALLREVHGTGAEVKTERANEAILSRTQLTCTPERIETCQRLAQVFLDYQFNRLNVTGERPTFAPVRFRIAPIKYLSVLNY